MASWFIEKGTGRKLNNLSTKALGRRQIPSPCFFIFVFLRWLHHGSLLNWEMTFSEGVEHSVFFVDSAWGATLMSFCVSSHFVGWKGAAYTVQKFRCQSCWEIKNHCSAKATQSRPRAEEYHFCEGHLWLSADRGESVEGVPLTSEGRKGEAKPSVRVMIGRGPMVEVFCFVFLIRI